MEAQATFGEETVNTLAHINREIASTETDLAAMRDQQNEQRVHRPSTVDEKLDHFSS